MAMHSSMHIACSMRLLLLLSALAVVQPFATRQTFVAPVQRMRRVPFCRPPFLHAAKKKGGDDMEDDIIGDEGDWEPDESELLNGMDDIDVESVQLDDLQDASVVIVDEDVAEEAPPVAEDELIDDDEDDLEISEEFEWEDEDDASDLGDAAAVVAASTAVAASAQPKVEEEAVDVDATGSGFSGKLDANDENFNAVPLQDDPDDPDYQSKKEEVEATVERRKKIIPTTKFDPYEVLDNMSEEELESFENMPYMKELQAKVDEAMPGTLEEEDLEGIDIEKEIEESSDLLNDDPYENTGEVDIFGTGVDDDMMEKLDDAWKAIHKISDQESWNKVDVKSRNMDWSTLSAETLSEMEDCLDEIGGSSYNVTNWLLYDLDFNVTNLLLAAIKHNPNAPILLQHWYPQMATYKRYEAERSRNFDFTWDDVDAADITELETYYAGFGYNEIPKKQPAETGIIGMGDLDEEEIKMAAYQEWMNEVYNPEWDRKDFDDDDLRDEDNVYSKFFEEPQHPDLPKYEDVEEDMLEWKEDFDERYADEDGNLAPEDKKLRDHYGEEIKLNTVYDEEFQREFRGHLIIACTADDSDLEIAEKITARMKEELGKKVWVETRVLAHAREEDNVFEVWLESYDIELLHSKKRALANNKGWTGPAVCDDAQVEYLVEEVRFLVSDEKRYSYTFNVDLA